ncbi:MAG: hypothetical protein GX587_08860, partial [Bacteroidales bacterium]|nr:hypothetical protein [Bacteroidales bacterium]
PDGAKMVDYPDAAYQTALNELAAASPETYEWVLTTDQVIGFDLLVQNLDAFNPKYTYTGMSFDIAALLGYSYSSLTYKSELTGKYFIVNTHSTAMGAVLGYSGVSGEMTGFPMGGDDGTIVSESYGLVLVTWHGKIDMRGQCFNQTKSFFGGGVTFGPKLGWNRTVGISSKFIAGPMLTSDYQSAK